jgi:nucleotide-binding universal stress UspA family protein
MDTPDHRPAGESSLRAVVAATDFSESADIALSWAMTIARRHGVCLHVVHAVSRTLPLLSRQDALSPLAEISIGESERRLTKLAERIRSPDQAVETHLLHNRPSVSILKVADWERAGLIVLGTRGLGGVDHLMIGSTAERVSEQANCPVLNVGPRSKETTSLPRRILIATDFSIESDAAAIAAQEICGAGNRDIEILLVTILNTPSGLEKSAVVGRWWLEYVGECRALLREKLAVLSGTFGSEIISAQSVLREGTPATEIARIAIEEEVDLIAMGSRGSFAAGRGFLGSVSKRVIQLARCPVLTVPSLLSKRMRTSF